MSFLKGRSEEEVGGSIDMPSSSSANGNNLSAFIDQGSEFEGKLTFKDTVRIDGRFRGEIASENSLIVGETGEIEASVRVRNVVVSGSVTGNIHAAQQLTLHKMARVQGDVEVGSIAVEEGAQLNGRVTMGSAEAARSNAAHESDSPSGRGRAGRPADDSSTSLNPILSAARR